MSEKFPVDERSMTICQTPASSLCSIMRRGPHCVSPNNARIGIWQGERNYFHFFSKKLIFLLIIKATNLEKDKLIKN